MGRVTLFDNGARADGVIEFSVIDGISVQPICLRVLAHTVSRIPILRNQMIYNILGSDPPLREMFLAHNVCEEIIFRGVTYEASKKGLNPFQAMCVSAVFFGLAHMNLNQAAYAFVLGLILVLLKKATGSLWTTILFHVVFNGYNVGLLYLQPYLTKATAETEEVVTAAEYRDVLLMGTSVYMVIALVTTALAGCVLAWIAGNEGRKEELKDLWRKRKEGKGKILRIPFLLAVSLYLGMMVADALWL